MYFDDIQMSYLFYKLRMDGHIDGRTGRHNQPTNQHTNNLRRSVEVSNVCMHTCMKRENIVHPVKYAQGLRFIMFGKDPFSLCQTINAGKHDLIDTVNSLKIMSPSKVQQNGMHNIWNKLYI